MQFDDCTDSAKGAVYFTFGTMTDSAYYLGLSTLKQLRPKGSKTYRAAGPGIHCLLVNSISSSKNTVMLQDPVFDATITNSPSSIV